MFNKQHILLISSISILERSSIRHIAWGKTYASAERQYQPQRELFQIDLEQLIDLKHPLVQLGMRINWESFEEALGAQMRQVKSMIGEQVGEVHVNKRSRGRTPRTLWRWIKHRAAAEPCIGHLKTEHRLERNRLKGTYGDAFNAVLSAAAMNFQKLLEAFWRIFTAPPDAHLGMDSGPTRATPPANVVCKCLKATYSGSTSYFPMQNVEKIRFKISSGVVWPVSESSAPSAR